ncbi:MAG: glycosyltransferase family 2 protein [Chthoniobacteraceae bacterium]|nr:glycosyltransferase family 2 protein [Chthoniobacteraceae bacterium]
MANISVVVPCYNSCAFLEKTIESVLAQDVGGWELILVDDGSTDATPEIIAAACARDPRIRGIRQENAGRAKACNTGAARGAPESRYLFFLDSDDLLLPSALRKMSAYLDAHPEVGLLGCQFQEIDPGGHPFGHAKRSRWVPGLFFPRRLRDSEYATPFVTFFCATGQGPFALLRKAVFQQTTGWEETLSRYSAQEDTDMFCQMALRAAVHYLPERLYLKRVHGASITHQFSRIQEAYTLFRQKWDHYQTDDPRQQALLTAARRHYATRHKPFRDLKVALQTLPSFLRAPSKARWDWMAALYREAWQGFTGKARE